MLGQLKQAIHGPCRCLCAIPKKNPPPPSRSDFVQILSYMLGLEQMSQLKCFGVFASVAGAVWVEVFATSDWAAAAEPPDASDPAAIAAAATETAGVEGGGAPEAGGGDIAAGWGWLGSLILLWQVCVHTGRVPSSSCILAWLRLVEPIRGGG